MKGIRDARKVWNHVDELRVEPDLVARLARNGLRVGVASEGSWPAIHAVFDAGGAEVRRDQLLASPGSPVEIDSGSIHESESIFSYGADNRLAGKTFSAGKKTIRIDYALRPEFGPGTDLQIGFEVRSDRGEMTWERSEVGAVRQVATPDRHPFGDLHILLTLHAGEFLVIGLSDEADNEYLIGSRFLTTERAGERRETLLCVMPQPYQVQNSPPQGS
jgi:hypothetical protein